MRVTGELRTRCSDCANRITFKVCEGCMVGSHECEVRALLCRKEDENVREGI
jgi:hypothetical protein